MTSPLADLVIVSNRLPVDISQDAQGVEHYRRSPGGLVTALEPVLQHDAGAWVGWTGNATADGETSGQKNFTYHGINIVPVSLSSTEISRYYDGISNGTLWPLYHDAIEKHQYHRQWWNFYESVNHKFAHAAAAAAAPGATIWVHDYQLQLVPAYLRALRPDVKIGFFLHIPFPPVNLFMQIPSRNSIVEGLLGADLVGFHLPRDARNFLEVVTYLTSHPNGKLPTGISVSDGSVQYNGRTVSIGAFPISIDSNAVKAKASSAEVQKLARTLRKDFGNPKKIILGVDRLDYTKGIDVRLRAYKELLEDGKISSADTIYVQIAVPSRGAVASYQKLRDTIELLVSRINGDWAQLNRPAVHYIHRTVTPEELYAFYLAADVMLVTPFRDGMNLVAKEYIVCHYKGTGALVLSEFAGAAEELTSAYIVNPHDIAEVKSAIESALSQTPEEEHRRMNALVSQVLNHDVGLWSRNFLDALSKT